MSNRPEEGYVPCGVWRVRGVHNTVYLAGTSHIVGTNQIPFPSPFYAAYQDAQEVYVEADTQSLLTVLRLLPKMLKWMKAHQAELICPKDRTLSDYLSPQTLERLRAFYGRDMRRERMTPLFLLFVSEAGSMNQQGGSNGGVEDVFALAARKDFKPIRELDDKDIADTALMVMDEMFANWKRDIAEHGADTVVQKEILENDELDDMVWRRGDMAAVERVQAEMKKELPSMYDRLLPERNRKWVAKLKVALQGKRNVMVLVGVAHFGGKEGLLQLLQEAGFTVEQMYGVDQPAAAASLRR
jgi:uncharacterized protein YbaP (TraB family)